MKWIAAPDAGKKRAVAYYRHSAQDRQENSVEIQQDQVRAFADEHDIEIIKEFADRGKSGLSTENRHAFTEMLHDYVEKRQEDFDYVLVLDVSRWGRFQDTDLSAYYTGLCSVHGVRVVYTTIGFPKDDDLLQGLQISIERYRAASYSRELSTKVFKGCAKIAQQGYRAGGKPPYGLRRLLLDEARNPVQVLEPGQRKSIQNQRVTLTPGDPAEVRIIRRIYREFLRKDLPPAIIAENLNARGLLSPGGKTWNSGSVTSILRNEMYAGTIVYNKTTQRLKSQRAAVPESEWVRAPGAFDGIVSMDDFERAAAKLKAQQEALELQYSDAEMTRRLGELYDRYGTVSRGLIAADERLVSPSTYSKHFGSISMAYNAIYGEVVESRRAEVIATIRASVERVDDYGTFIVVNNHVSIHIQPVVPFPDGYEACWSFRPVMSVEVDITLGVPLNNGGEFHILGYLLFARLMCQNRPIQFSSRSPERFAYHCYELSQLVNVLFAA